MSVRLTPLNCLRRPSNYLDWEELKKDLQTKTTFVVRSHTKDVRDHKGFFSLALQKVQYPRS